MLPKTFSTTNFKWCDFVSVHYGHKYILIAYVTLRRIFYDFLLAFVYVLGTQAVPKNVVDFWIW